jgi:hypothetical protein
MLEERSLNSGMVLCRHFRIGKVTCLRIFQDMLGLTTFQFYLLVPHAPSINQKSERVSYSKLPLTTLMEQKANGFQWMIARDESWFLLYYPCDSVWAAARDEPLQRTKHKIDMEKCLVSIL